MGLWSSVNKKEKFRDGKEDFTAAYRSQLRRSGSSDGEDELPDVRRGGSRMPRKEARAMDRVLKDGKPARKGRKS